jgi:acylphosphatase
MSMHPRSLEPLEAPPRLRLRGTVAGRVQGVGFRAFVRHHAQRLGLDGWVRNLPGREVELDAAGPAPALAKLEHLVKKGPTFARVERHQLTLETPDPQAPAPGTGFEVTR